MFRDYIWFKGKVLFMVYFIVRVFGYSLGYLKVKVKVRFRISFLI